MKDRETPKTKTSISRLALAARMFAPIIVNDSGERWDGKPDEAPEGYAWAGTFDRAKDIPDEVPTPTFDEFINIAAHAIGELSDFIKYHEHLKQVLTSTQAAFANIEVIVFGTREETALQPLKTTEEIARIVNENKQMKDVLEKAASSSPAQALSTTQSWVFKNGTGSPLIQCADGQDSAQN